MKQCASSVRIRILVKSQRIRTYMDFDTQRFKEVSRYRIFPDTEKVRIKGNPDHDMHLMVTSRVRNTVLLEITVFIKYTGVNH